MPEKIEEIISNLAKFGILDVEDQNLDIDDWNMRISNEFRNVFNYHLKMTKDFGLSFVKSMEDMVKRKTDYNTFSDYCKVVFEAIQVEIELSKQGTDQQVSKTP